MATDCMAELPFVDALSSSASPGVIGPTLSWVGFVLCDVGLPGHLEFSFPHLAEAFHQFLRILLGEGTGMIAHLLEALG